MAERRDRRDRRQDRAYAQSRVADATVLMGVFGFGAAMFALGRAGRESCSDVLNDRAVELLILQAQNPGAAQALIGHAAAADHPGLTPPW